MTRTFDGRARPCPPPTTYVIKVRTVRTKRHFSFDRRAYRLKWEQYLFLSLSRAHFIPKCSHFLQFILTFEKYLASDNNEMTNCKVSLFSPELMYFFNQKISIFQGFLPKSENKVRTAHACDRKTHLKSENKVRTSQSYLFFTLINLRLPRALFSKLYIGDRLHNGRARPLEGYL
jgi:hypothetical protein